MPTAAEYRAARQVASRQALGVDSTQRPPSAHKDLRKELSGEGDLFSQRSKENICDGQKPDTARLRSSLSHSANRRSSALSNTPIKAPNQDAQNKNSFATPASRGGNRGVLCPEDDSSAKNSFATPSRLVLQKPRLPHDDLASRDAASQPAMLQNLPSVRSSLEGSGFSSPRSPMVSARSAGDLAAQVQSLRKDRSSLEARNLALESQLEAVILSQDLMLCPEDETSAIIQERDRLRETVRTLQVQLEAAVTDQRRHNGVPELILHRDDDRDTDPCPAAAARAQVEALRAQLRMVENKSRAAAGELRVQVQSFDHPCTNANCTHCTDSYCMRCLTLCRCQLHVLPLSFHTLSHSFPVCCPCHAKHTQSVLSCPCHAMLPCTANAIQVCVCVCALT